MTTTSSLPALPPDAALAEGLWTGALDRDPREGRRGRTRRWSYSAAGSDDVAIGAAVVDLGFASTAFAWCLLDGRLVTWDARGIPGLAARIGTHAATTARFRGGGGRLSIGANGDLEADVPVPGGRLRVRVEVEPDQPAVCVVATTGGGWNATQKVAGERARIHVAAPTARVSTTGGAWRDWTLGAQDRHTRWRWAAAAGRATDGRRVGVNVSTGMNAAGAGEDVVWWDGVPQPLDVHDLGPASDGLAGDWRVSGPGWALALRAEGVRTADENLLVVRSRYVQPVGTFTGTLPGPDGTPVDVSMVGVTEDHRATW